MLQMAIIGRKMCTVLAVLGINFKTDLGQHILKNPLVVASMVEKVRVHDSCSVVVTFLLTHNIIAVMLLLLSHTTYTF